MSVNDKMYPTFYMKSGKYTKRKFILADTNILGKSGIFVLFAPSAAESFIGQIQPMLDGVIYAYKIPLVGSSEDKKLMANPSSGNQSTHATYTVSFSDTDSVCKIYIPLIKTLKVEDIKPILAGLNFQDRTGTALTVANVSVAMNV